TIFNMMLGVIEERTREIGTLSVVGLSPLHISFMFLAEITEYAVIGTVFGYIAGIVGMSLIQTLGIGLGIILNYSSNLVAISLGISSAATVAASLIPARR
ncbi:MAG: FtsX-like permease family protein, partial [Nitrososphaeria archaeon]|nr:FtsX-like permease family protein [Nitrososphaeria archaeon]